MERTCTRIGGPDRQNVTCVAQHSSLPDNLLFQQVWLDHLASVRLRIKFYKRKVKCIESNEEVLVDIRIILRSLQRDNSVSNVSSESLYYLHSFSTQNRISPEKYHTVECRVQRGKRV